MHLQCINPFTSTKPKWTCLKTFHISYHKIRKCKNSTMQSFCQRCTPHISSTYESQTREMSQNISPKLRKVISRGIAHLSIRPSLETIHFFIRWGLEAGRIWGGGGGGHAKKYGFKGGQAKKLRCNGESLTNSFNFCSDGIGDNAKSLPESQLMKRESSCICYRSYN